MVLKSLKNGFSQLWQYKRIWALLYLLTFVLAGFVAYPLKTYLGNKVEHSLMAKDMLEGFNYTFYTDFMNHYGDGISSITSQSTLVIGLYLLLFIFLMGGIISTFLKRPDAYDRSLFWGESAHYFWRMLVMSGLFLFLHGCVLAAFLFIYMKITGGISPLQLESEGIIFITMKYMIPVYVLFASFFFMWQDYTKITLVKNDEKWVIPSIFNSIKFILKNFRKTFGLYLLNMLLLIVVFIINYYVTSSFEIRTTPAIFMSFALSQIFVITRLGLKLVNLSSASFLYKATETNIKE